MLLTQEMSHEAVQSDPEMFGYVPNQYKTQEMYHEAVQSDPEMFEYVPDQYKTQKMCNEAVESESWMLKHVSDWFVTQKICNEAVQRAPRMFEYAPDWFVTLQEFDDVLKLRYAYIKRKAQKAQIKEELMPVAWHPDRWWNWCVPEDEKKELEKYFT